MERGSGAGPEPDTRAGPKRADSLVPPDCVASATGALKEGAGPEQEEPEPEPKGKKLIGLQPKLSELEGSAELEAAVAPNSVADCAELCALS